MPLEKFHAVYEVVFVDSTGYYNLCGNMSSAIYHRVRHEAAMALKLLEKECTESFEDLFMTKMHFVESFDVVCQLVIPIYCSVWYRVQNKYSYIDKSYCLGLSHSIHQIVKWFGKWPMAGCYFVL